MTEQNRQNGYPDNSRRNKRFFGHLKRVGRAASTLEQIADLAETIEAQEVIAACKAYLTNNVSSIPKEEV